MSVRLVPRSPISNCTACGAVFNFFRNRFTCRRCDKDFCENCTKGRIAIRLEENAPLVQVCDKCMAEVIHTKDDMKEHFQCLAEVTQTDANIEEQVQNFERNLEEECKQFRLCLDKFKSAMEEYKVQRTDFEEKELVFLDRERNYFESLMNYISIENHLEMVLAAKNISSLQFLDGNILLDMEKDILDITKDEYEVCLKNFLEHEKTFLVYKEEYEMEKNRHYAMIKRFHGIRSLDMKLQSE